MLKILTIQLWENTAFLSLLKTLANFSLCFMVTKHSIMLKWFQDDGNNIKKFFSFQLFMAIPANLF